MRSLAISMQCSGVRRVSVSFMNLCNRGLDLCLDGGNSILFDVLIKGSRASFAPTQDTTRSFSWASHDALHALLYRAAGIPAIDSRRGLGRGWTKGRRPPPSGRSLLKPQSELVSSVANVRTCYPAFLRSFLVKTPKVGSDTSGQQSPSGPAQFLKCDDRSTPSRS